MTYVLITTAQHSIPNQALERSEFARRLNDGIGICTARTFKSKESATQFADKIITAIHSYATPAENARGHWTTPYSYFYSRMWHNFVPLIIPLILNSSYKTGRSWDLNLKKIDDDELIYRLLYYKNEEQQRSYDYSSRSEAIKQASKLLDKADLEPTTEENENGYWHGVNEDGQDIRLELHILVPNSEGEYDYSDYMNISPAEVLSNDCYERFNSGLLIIKNPGGLLAAWLLLLCLSSISAIFIFFSSTFSSNSLNGITSINATWVVLWLIIDILGITNTIKKI